MIIAEYTMGGKLHNRVARIGLHHGNILSDNFGKYYLDILGPEGSDNDIHGFKSEETTEEIEK